MENTRKQWMRFWGILCYLFVLYSLVLPVVGDGCQKIANLSDFKNRMEEKVKKISDALAQKYKNICHPDIQTCSLKSYDLCEGTGPRTCLYNFPTPEQCVGSGLWLSDSSGVRISNALAKKNLTHSARKFICATAQIEPVFQQLRRNNSIQYSYAYIGSSSGVIRVSPAFKQEQNLTTNKCVNYDPRKRPWYVSAITGSKTTVVLLDLSKTMTSMHPGVRFVNAKVTLEIIFQTLNNFDYIGVVVFCKNARSLTFTEIVSASQENKNKILQDIRKLTTGSGTTNYTAAIQRGMKMLENMETQCKNSAETVFLLLTDGYTDNDRPESLDSFQALISTKLNNLGKSVENFKLISFVYGIEQNIDYTIVKQLTCTYKGIIFRIWDGIDEFTMVEKLTSYYTFLSEGIDHKQIKPMWSNFYLDAFGFGMIVSVTMPIYVEGLVNKIVGVAGIDILLSKFQQCGYDLSYVQNQLRYKPPCFKSTLDPNQLLYLRCRQGNVVCNNSSCNDVVISPQQVCSATISYDVFYASPIDSTNDDDKCCYMTIKKLVAIILSSVLSILTTIGVILLYKKGYIQKLYNKCKKKPNPKVEADDSSKASLLGNQNLLLDPQKKYKEAEENGIKIYREPQFYF